MFFQTSDVCVCRATCIVHSPISRAQRTRTERTQDMSPPRRLAPRRAFPHDRPCTRWLERRARPETASDTTRYVKLKKRPHCSCGSAYCILPCRNERTTARSRPVALDERAASCRNDDRSPRKKPAHTSPSHYTCQDNDAATGAPTTIRYKRLRLPSVHFQAPPFASSATVIEPIRCHIPQITGPNPNRSTALAQHLSKPAGSRRTSAA
jgi:hypothetical protein